MENWVYKSKRPIQPKRYGASQSQARFNGYKSMLHAHGIRVKVKLQRLRNAALDCL